MAIAEVDIGSAGEAGSRGEGCFGAVGGAAAMAGDQVATHAAVVPSVVSIDAGSVIGFGPGIDPEGVAECGCGGGVLDGGFGFEGEVFVSPGAGPATGVEPGIEGETAVIPERVGGAPDAVGGPDPGLVGGAAFPENADAGWGGGGFTVAHAVVFGCGGAGAGLVGGGVVFDVGGHPEILILGVGDGAVEVVDVHEVGEAHLFGVIHAPDGLAFGLGFGEGGQEHAGEDGDDGDDDEEFD